MRKKFSDKKSKFLQALNPRRTTREGGSSAGGTPTTTRPSTPTPTSVPGRATPAADLGAGSVTASGTGVDAQASVAGGNHSITDPNVSPSPSGMSSTSPPDDQTILQQVREWWKAHRGTVLASAQFVLESVEKGLDGMPVPGPKAAIGAFAGVVKAVRTLDENHTSVDEITEKVEELTGALAQFMATTLPDVTTASVSEDMKIRVEEFSGRLTKIKTSASAHPTTWKNVLVRLADAERVSEELKDVWTKIQVEYLHLITVTGLSTERKIDEGQKRRLLDRLSPVHSAVHDHAKAAPSCLNDTRVELLAEIAGWMADPSAQPVYWLKGVAGTGKTAIAQSVASMADAKECRRLIGSFFFSRTGAVDRRNAAAVIPTLTYQLALKYEPFRPRLCDAIDSEPDVSQKNLQVQAKVLLSDAFDNVPCPFPHPLVVVIDALDECDKQQGVEGGKLVPVLLGALWSLPFCVKIFITSRPESSIENMFSRADLRDHAKGLALHRDIEDSVVRADIGRYLRYELDELAVDHPFITVPPVFPSDDQFGALQDRAGALFIYARTALEFVKNPNTDPRRQIELLLSTDPREASHGFGELDALYIHVVSQALKHSGIRPQAVRDVLASLVLLYENMPASALAALNSIKEEDCQAVVRSLASVILYDREFAEPIRPIHLSFSDFLLDRERSTDAYVANNVPAHHLRLAERCLQIMNEHLQMDICDIRDPSLFNTDVTDLKQRLDKVAPPHLRYACMFWHVHFELAGTVSAGAVSHLEDFCAKHLLHWLELLSLLDKVPMVLTSMTPFLAHLRGFEGIQDTYALLSDVMRLAAAYQIPVMASALHVYHSTVVTMPSCRLQELARKDVLLPVLISERPSSWQSTLEAHSDVVSSVAFSYDGQYIVSGSEDSTVRLWDTATGILLQTMNDHEGEVRSVAFFGDGKNLRIVSAESDDCTMRIWDAITGFQLRTINHEQRVLSVAASRNGQLLASGSADHAIRLWDSSTGALRHVINGHSGEVYSVAFSSDSKLVVSGSEDCTLRVWDAATGMQQLVVGGREERVQSTVFLRQDRFIVSGSLDNTIRVWSVDTGAPVLTIQHAYIVCSLAVLHNEDLIASGTDDGTIRLWDAATGHLQRSIVTGHNDWITAIAMSADSKFVTVGYRDGPLWVSEMMTPTDVQRRSQTAHTGMILAVAFSGNGMFIASGSTDCMAKVWRAKTALELSTMSGHTEPITSVALSGDGKLVVSGSYDRTVRLWEATTGTELHVFAGHKDFVFSVALSGDNKLVASGSGDRTVRVWDVVTGTHLYAIRDHKDAVTSVVFSNDSSFIISGSWDGTILMCDAATGTHRQTITGHEHEYVAFSKDGNYIFSRPSSAEDDTMQVWEVSKVIPADGAYLLQDVEAPGSLCCDQFKIDRDGWVSRLSTQKSWQRLCWLPTERRSSRTQVPSFGHTVCIGSDSGIVTILDFSHVRVP